MSTAKTVATVIVVAALLGAMPGVASAAAEPDIRTWHIGIGSDAALNGPLCNPDTGRVKIPSWNAPACVRPWKRGDDNGGATSRGVTATSIKVVGYLPNEEQIRSAGTPAPRNRATGTAGDPQQAILDANAALAGRYEMYGRKLEWEFVTSSGTDEAAQRADAIKVTALKPFAVVSNVTGDNTFVTELAARKVLVAYGGSGNNKDAAAQAPYRWTGQDQGLVALAAARFVGRSLAGKKASFAGDDLAGRTRKFAVVYNTSTRSGDEIDVAEFTEEFSNEGGKLSERVSFNNGTGDPATVMQEATTQAPSMVARLKQAGVTSVIVMTGYRPLTALTKAATDNEFFPEWITTGYQLQDLALFAQAYDADQLPHMFGMIWLAPYVASPRGLTTAENVIDWYWGPNAGTTSNAAIPNVANVSLGVHTAGPDLTPKNVQRGLFALPGRGGSFVDQVTSIGNKVGDVGAGNNVYTMQGPKDWALAWWDPEARGLANITGNALSSGNWRYLDNAKRYGLDDWKKRSPKFFQDLATSVTHFDDAPAADLPPDYPCTGCPSEGGAA